MSAYWVLFWSFASPIALAAAVLITPAIREALGKYFLGSVQHSFDKKIETLKSELRISEEKVSAQLRANEQGVKLLSDAAINLRSSRMVALDARRLQAVEKLWSAKIEVDSWRLTAIVVSQLNLDEILKDPDSRGPAMQRFASTFDGISGPDPTKKSPAISSASERPFVTADVWASFYAYQSVMTHSAVILKSLASGMVGYLKREDALKPIMLAALPEYKDYIEKFGLSGYYHLLDALEQKLLKSISEMLDGKDVDAAALSTSAKLISAARDLEAVPKLDVPGELRGPEIPDPPKM
ncbi:MAG: hypothetical protein ABS54_14585 [Hyphomicrobium sp. SCN 65-11]|nr:MAG: hypothetical protein ABS54_14585 [Hyphomicrobium sp. SCN 65-11]